MSGFFSKLQKLGKALMLPIAVLPVAGILLRLGQADVMTKLGALTIDGEIGNQFLHTLLQVCGEAGNAVFGTNMAFIFAIGIAVGLAKANHGAAGLAGAVGFLMLENVTKVIWQLPQFAGETHSLGVFGGIIIGIVAGCLYNKFYDIKLPDFLGFFGGKRFVPIVTGFSATLLGVVLGYIWPYVERVFAALNSFIAAAGAVGDFCFGFFNRLLIPTGLHHVLNNYVWQLYGDYNGTTGDLNRFFALDPTAGKFMTGFFPIMMFALPAAALAMYVCARKENKAVVGGALASVAFTAFLTGITEPLEFMFMFLAPVLYGIHAVLTGISMAVVNLLGIRSGFSFSAGAIDLAINWGISEKPFMLILIGLIFAVIYFFIFVFAIKKFNIPTPGRENDAETDEMAHLVEDKGLSELAAMYIEKLGGKNNIQEVDSCITRLRLTLKDSKIVEEKDMKALGAAGIMRPNSKNLQVIVGTKAELIAEEMKKLL
ncbi:MAG: N-acetylglucosamine-specific PTS transporter subunit IIBC [Zhenhengia sp.]